MKMALAFLSAACAMGILLATFIFGMAGRSVSRKGRSISEYYFRVEHRPKEKGLADQVLEKGPKVEVILFLLLGLVFLAAVLGLTGQAKQLEAAVTVLLKTSELLLPLTVMVVILFATLKKPYYALFEARDVVKKYWILKCTYIAVILRLLVTALQIMKEILDSNRDPFWAAFLTLLISACMSLIALMNSFRVIFSDKNCELTLLDNLAYHIYEYDDYLKRMDCGDAKAVDIMNQYLVDYLKKDMKRFAGMLKRHMPLTKVEFYDATEVSPITVRGRRLWNDRYLLGYMLMFLFFGGMILWCVLLSRYFVGLQYFSQHALAIILISVGVILACLCAMNKCKLLRAMKYQVAYGGWGYRFLDDTGTPQLYFSKRQSVNSCGARWQRGVFNIMVAYRIELLHGEREDMLRKLELILREDRSKEEQRLWKLVYFMCAYLALERVDESEGKMLVARVRGRLSSTCDDPLFASFAAALMADVERDACWYVKQRGASMT